MPEEEEEDQKKKKKKKHSADATKKKEQKKKEVRVRRSKGRVVIVSQSRSRLGVPVLLWMLFLFVFMVLTDVQQYGEWVTTLQGWLYIAIVFFGISFIFSCWIIMCSWWGIRDTYGAQVYDPRHYRSYLLIGFLGVIFSADMFGAVLQIYLNASADTINQFNTQGYTPDDTVSTASVWNLETLNRQFGIVTTKITTLWYLFAVLSVYCVYSEHYPVTHKDFIVVKKNELNIMQPLHHGGEKDESSSSSSETDSS
jgi:hypothetical protein